MLRNILLVAVRILNRQKAYSFINITGLTIGIVCTLLIFLWIKDEWEKDKYYADSDKLYRIITYMSIDGSKPITWDQIPGPMLAEFVDPQTDIEASTHSVKTVDFVFDVNGSMFIPKGIWADAHFLDFFGIAIKQGARKLDPQDKAWIAISASLAKKLFGDSDPIGKQIKVNDKWDVVVRTVFSDHKKSSFSFEYILPHALYRDFGKDNYRMNHVDHVAYIKLKSGVNHQEVAKKITDAVTERDKEIPLRFTLHKVSDQYLYNKFEAGIPVGGRIEIVRIFTFAALFILLMACINFTNIATARAMMRVKEVGVRKVSGAMPRALVIQFLIESLVQVLIGYVLAIILALVLLPAFNLWIKKEILLELTSIPFIIFSLTCIIVITVLAGFYPAFILSGLRPAQVLKGNSIINLGGSGLRKALVITQLAITVILVSSSIILYNQIQYIQTKDVGYNRDALLTYQTRQVGPEKLQVLESEINKIVGVQSTTRSENYQSIANMTNMTSSFTWTGKNPNDQTLVSRLVVGDNYFETLGIKLKEGRFFSNKYNDSATFILTQKAADLLTGPVLGQKVSINDYDGTVVGIVEDIHSQSFEQAIHPIVFVCDPHRAGLFTMRIDPASLPVTLQKLQELHQQFDPKYPFSYSFVEDEFERNHEMTSRISGLSLAFTIVALLIASLGLLGLVSYATERNRKSICIRKTFGATVGNLTTSYLMNFLKLTFWALPIGSLFGYYFMNDYLERYAYRVPVSWQVFALTGSTIIILTVAVVLHQIIRAASSNPAEVLRNE